MFFVFSAPDMVQHTALHATRYTTELPVRASRLRDRKRRRTHNTQTSFRQKNLGWRASQCVHGSDALRQSLVLHLS
jgi:hypothetical protein